jgi:hypothetical protein
MEKETANVTSESKRDERWKKCQALEHQKARQERVRLYLPMYILSSSFLCGDGLKRRSDRDDHHTNNVLKRILSGRKLKNLYKYHNIHMPGWRLIDILVWLYALFYLELAFILHFLGGSAWQC